MTLDLLKPCEQNHALIDETLKQLQHVSNHQLVKQEMCIETVKLSEANFQESRNCKTNGCTM